LRAAQRETGDEAATVDVLIAGVPSFGLMLANELGRRGVRAALFDAKPSTAFNPQANATQARTIEHYPRLGFRRRRPEAGAARGLPRRTSVPGVWAAGNAANPRAHVITAAGEGSAVAIPINAELVQDDVDPTMQRRRRGDHTAGRAAVRERRRRVLGRFR
jgi:thioredoxin reductase